MIEQFTRTFHPVGQGAFYTEKIVTATKTYNIVYDCGSITAKELVHLDKQIKGAFAEGEDIDLLFISHFHADHINGIGHLKKEYKIHKVVLPYLDEKTKVLTRISLTLENEDVAIIDNPKSYFGENTTIIQVKPISDNTNNRDQTEYTLEELDDKDIDSGSKIRMGIDWYYIPYNYELTARSSQFINKLRRLGVSIADIKTIDQIISKKEKIVKAYEEINKKLNPLSLVVYSGNNYTRLKTYCNKHCYRYFKSDNAGCLYLGDIDLNQPNIVDEIKKHLGCLWETVSTIQIPHHGSIENFNDSILEPSIKFAVLSYGTTNSFGHPASFIQGSLLLNNIYPFHVTNIKSSIVIQFKR